MRSRVVTESGSLLSESERRLLNGLYTAGPAAYGSAKALKDASGLSIKKVKQYLHTKDAYTQFHIAYRKFPRLHVVAKAVNEIWCMDLAQMDKLAEHNQGVKYLLVSVDVLSRFVRVESMKDKTALSTKHAFMKMMSSGPQPRRVWTDQGTEFEGCFRVLCKNLGMDRYHTKGASKAAYAERAIRSLKNIIYRYLEENRVQSKFNYVSKLQTFVKIMNSRVNRSINMLPKDVTNADAIRIIHSRPSETYEAQKFVAGDYVRAVLPDETFRKGYKPQFSWEVYKIRKILTKSPVTYKLEDKAKKLLPGRFYQRQLIRYNV